VARNARAKAEQIAESKTMGWLARLGLAARGSVYIGMGSLSALVARGASAPADQSGVLTRVASQPFGTVLLWLLAAGFLGYAIWRVSEAIFGVPGTDNRLAARLKSLVRGAGYLALFFAALSALRGTATSQSGTQEQLAASIMSQPGGRWIVGLIGLVIIGVGIMMVIEGIRTKFLRFFSHLPARGRDLIVWMGRVGSVARGVVFGLTGSLVVYAAWTAEPSKAGGIDTAVRTLLDRPYGEFLVLLVSAGLIVFGIYGLAEAVWRRVPEGGIQ